MVNQYPIGDKQGRIKMIKEEWGKLREDKQERDRQERINEALVKNIGSKISSEFLEEKPDGLSPKDLALARQGSYGDFDWDPDSIPSNQVYAFIAEQTKRIEARRQKLLTLRAAKSSGMEQDRGFVRTEQGGVVSYNVDPREIASLKHLAVGSAGSTSRRKDSDM